MNAVTLETEALLDRLAGPPRRHLLRSNSPSPPPSAAAAAGAPALPVVQWSVTR